MNKTTGLVLAAIVVGIGAVVTFAFTAPTNNPGDADSSAGSLLSEMAGGAFNTSTDSLEALRDRIDGMGFNIEARTSDPTSPDNGRIWLRTDL